MISDGNKPQDSITEPEDLLADVQDYDPHAFSNIKKQETTLNELPPLEPSTWEIDLPETNNTELDNTGVLDPIVITDTNSNPIIEPLITTPIITNGKSDDTTEGLDEENSYDDIADVTYHFANNPNNAVQLNAYRKGPYLPHIVVPNTIVTDAYTNKGEAMYEQSLNKYSVIKKKQKRELNEEERAAVQYELSNYAEFGNKYGFSLLTTYLNNEHTHLLETRETNFNQDVTSSSNRRINILSASKGNAPDTYLTGLDGLNYISGIVNGGNSVRIPLWHSGFSITLGNFELDELGNFEILANNIKAQLGVDTHGNIYNSENVVIVGTILDFILKKVQKTSVAKGLDLIKLGDILNVNDIPIIIAGALEGIFPHGYPLVVGCVSSHKTNCNFTLEREKDSEGRIKPEGLIKFAKALWTDTTIITPAMAEIMCSGNVTMDHVIAYQNSLNGALKVTNEKTILEADDLKVSIVFKVPTINEYRTAGNTHNRRVGDKVTEIMSTMVDGDNSDDIAAKRKNIIEQFSQKMYVGEYLAWYKEIRIYVNGKSNPNIVTNSDDFIKYLNMFTRYDNFKTNLIKAYQEFRDDNIISMVGYNNFNCPNCGCNQVLDTPEDIKLWMGYNGRYPSIIPINLVNTFLVVVAYMSDTTQLT